MGGAFVAVADDASADVLEPRQVWRWETCSRWWSTRVDRVQEKNLSQDPQSRHRLPVALAMPAVGLSYYRLEVHRSLPWTFLQLSPVATSRQSPVGQAQLGR